MLEGRLQFKVTVLILKVLHAFGPNYLRDCHVFHNSNLLSQHYSTGNIELLTRRGRLMRGGDWTYIETGLRLWNSLPLMFELSKQSGSWRKGKFIINNGGGCTVHLIKVMRACI